MEEYTLLLNLKCIELGIIQLGDISGTSIRDQLRSLSPEDRRNASRKIKKLTKKAINKFARSREQKQLWLKNAGFAQNNLRKSSSFKAYQRRRLELVKRLLLSDITKDTHAWPYSY